MVQEQLSSSADENRVSSPTPDAVAQLFTERLITDDELSSDMYADARIMRPPRLLLTLLADYWWPQKVHLPSAALVALLAEFGISDTAARAAINRLARHDVLISSRQGRQVFYRLSERAQHNFDEGARFLFSFGLPLSPWDGTWSLVAFSIPEEKRQVRYILRDRLRWLGFAPLYDGLWISPRDNLSDAASVLAELAISASTLLRAHIMDGTPATGLPQHAWDLAALRAQYEQFISAVQPLSIRVRDGGFSPEEALKTRTRVVNAWESFPMWDPGLPDEILPPDWPRAQARQLFIEIYDTLGPLAQRRVQQIIARYAPDLAGYATYHRSDVWRLIEPTGIS